MTENSVRDDFSSSIDKLLSRLLSISAIVVAVVVVAKYVGSPRQSQSASGPQFESVHHGNWREWFPKGILVGSDSAPIVITEFVDFECPYCQRFHHGPLRDVREVYGDKISMLFVHYPLRMHRFARPAALAAECAAAQGHASAVVDLLFAKQDSFGLKLWESYAAEAGVKDSARFSECLRSAVAPRIDEGHALAKELKLPGTPSLFINGWTFASGANSQELAAAVEAVLSGRQPVIERR